MSLNTYLNSDRQGLNEISAAVSADAATGRGGVSALLEFSNNFFFFFFLKPSLISHTILENIHFRKCFAVDVKLIAGGVDIDLDTSNYAIIVCVSV